MSIISATRTIQSDSASVWAAVADIGGVHRWHPKVRQSPLLSEANEGLGAKRRCDFYDGTSVVEEVTDWVEGDARPDDEWVEAIPYSQTRSYVKRVMRSLQAYRLLY